MKNLEDTNTISELYQVIAVTRDGNIFKSKSLDSIREADALKADMEKIKAFKKVEIVKESSEIDCLDEATSFYKPKLDKSSESITFVNDFETKVAKKMLSAKGIEPGVRGKTLTFQNTAEFKAAMNLIMKSEEVAEAKDGMYAVVGIDDKGKETKSEFLYFLAKKDAQDIVNDLNKKVKNKEIDPKWVKFKLVTEGYDYLSEPAVSQSQQKLMAMALSYKRGEMKDSDASDKVKELAANMSEKELEDFASTKLDDLPKKVNEAKDLYPWKDLEAAVKSQGFGPKIGRLADMLSGLSKKGTLNARGGSFESGDIASALNAVGIPQRAAFMILNKLGVYEGVEYEEETTELNEAKMSSTWDPQYTKLINEFIKLKWDSKVQKYKQSAETYYEGDIDNYNFVLTFHTPDTKWGPNWSFNGLLVTEDSSVFSPLSEELFTKTADQILDLSASRKPVPEDLQKKNIEELKDAIAWIKSKKYVGLFEETEELAEQIDPSKISSFAKNELDIITKALSGKIKSPLYYDMVLGDIMQLKQLYNIVIQDARVKNFDASIEFLTNLDTAVTDAIPRKLYNAIFDWQYENEGVYTDIKEHNIVNEEILPMD